MSAPPAARRYSIAGLEVDSAIGLPAFAGNSHLPAHIALTLRQGLPPVPDGHTIGGLNWALDGDAWHLWSGGGLHLMQRDNDLSIWCDGDPAAPEHIQWILGAGLSTCLFRRDCIPWHAAAIAFGDCVMLVMGESGSGKSTTTMALIAAGGLLLADDIVAPMAQGGRVVVSPAFLRLRLCADAAQFFRQDAAMGNADKVTVTVPHTKDSRVRPVHAVFILGARKEECGNCVRLPKSIALGELLRNVFSRPSMKLFAQEQLAATMAREIANSIPVFHLEMPQGLDRLAAFAATLPALIG